MNPDPIGRTPCSLATLPVFAICWTGAHRLTLLPEFVILVVGLAAPLVILLSENSWLNGAPLSIGTMLLLKSPTLKHRPVSLSHTTSLLLKPSPPSKKIGIWAIAAGAV